MIDKKTLNSNIGTSS